jgi:hypothetical protein
MKKIFQLTSILAAVSLLALSCTPEELSTDQYSSTAVVLQAYGPQPVVRGGTLRFIGSNLDQVKTVVIPENNQITDIQVINAGAHSEIRVTVPKETAAVGYPKLVLADGTEIVGKTLLEYSEPITIDELTPAAAYPGEVITFKGDYLNLIHEVVFNNKVVVSEDKFASHTRYEIKVAVPATAQTGVVALGTVDETKVDASSAEGKSLLATLNLVSPEKEFTVKTADGKAVAGTYKPGAEVTVNGTRLDLVKSVLLEGASPETFNATASKITFAMPAGAKTGNVTLVMESGVEVNAGTITSAQPTGLAAAPAPVKNGAQLTITGADLDLVTGIDLPKVPGAEFAFAEGKITLTVGENAQEGDITLWMANGLNVTVAYTLVKPTVTGFSANPASAGSDVTVEGTDLDLVAAVTFGGGIKVEVEAGADSFTVAVPTAAETAVLVLNLKNGTDVEAIELAIDKPAGAYIATFPEDMYAPGAMFIVEIENPDHLTGVQIDGVDVNYILNGNTLYLQIPDTARRGSELTLVSDNGSVTYTMNIDPGDIIETVLFQGPVDNGNWQNWEVPADTYTKVELKAGQTIRYYVTLKDSWWQMQFFDGHWGQMDVGFGNGYNVNAGIYDASEGFIAVTLTDELITLLTTYTDWGYSGILQWENLALEKITYYEDNSDGTEIWSGPLEITWGDGGRVALPTAAFQVAKAGQKLRLFYTQKDQVWAQAQVNDANWTTIDLSADGYANPLVPTDIYGWFSDGILDRCTEITLTQDLLDHLTANTTEYEGVVCSIIIQGSDLIFNKVTIK